MVSLRSDLLPEFPVRHPYPSLETNDRIARSVGSFEIKSTGLLRAGHTLVPGKIERRRPDESFVLGSFNPDKEAARVETVPAGIENRAVGRRKRSHPLSKRPAKEWRHWSIILVKIWPQSHWKVRSSPLKRASSSRPTHRIMRGQPGQRRVCGWVAFDPIGDRLPSRGSTGARPLAIMADRCHILLARKRGLRIGRRQYRGTTVANPAANELAWLIAKLHADPAIDPRRSVGTRVRQRRGRSKDQDAGNCAGNHDGCENCPAHCALSLKLTGIYARYVSKECHRLWIGYCLYRIRAWSEGGHTSESDVWRCQPRRPLRQRSQTLRCLNRRRQRRS